MARSFAGQVVIVTGASSGLGWEMARQLAAAGAKVGLVARREAELQDLATKIRAAGGVAEAAVADVGDATSITAAVETLRGKLGAIDCLIANAGVGVLTRLDPVNVVDVERMFRINVLGVVHSFAAVMPEMLARKSGHLVAVSSLAGYVGLPGESAYCASKAAVNVYLDGLRRHLRGKGVNVTTIRPGFVATPMTASNNFPMPGLLNADEAARRMLRAIARRDRIYNFPLGMTLLTKFSAWLPDWVLVRAMGDYNETH